MYEDTAKKEMLLEWGRTKEDNSHSLCRDLQDT